MLFATYGAPSPPKNNNPLVIILSVCGGCVLLVGIGIFASVMWAKNTFGGITQAILEIPKTSQRFATAVENHDWSTAADQVDPSAKGTITAAKIEAAEMAVEAKLGPVEPTAVEAPTPVQSPVQKGSGQPKYLEYTCSIPVKYKKGSATLAIHFKSGDLSGITSFNDMSKMKIPTKLTSFKISTDND